MVPSDCFHQMMKTKSDAGAKRYETTGGPLQFFTLDSFWQGGNEPHPFVHGGIPLALSQVKPKLFFFVFFLKFVGLRCLNSNYELKPCENSKYFCLKTWDWSPQIALCFTNLEITHEDVHRSSKEWLASIKHVSLMDKTGLANWPIEKWTCRFTIQIG